MKKATQESPIIIVTVRGGIVEGVYHTVPLRLIIEDWDCPDEGSGKPPSRNAYFSHATLSRGAAEGKYRRLTDAVPATDEAECVGIMTTDATIPKRVEKCRQALTGYSDDDCFVCLIDVLTDAMHFCDANGEDFHYALCVAGKHYLAERNDEQTEERRMP